MNNKLPYILCVDDDPLNLFILTEHLGSHYEVRTATNGQECIDEVAIRKPNLILLDVMMPVMNGMETCKILKSSEDTKDITIVVLSARSFKNEIDMMLDLGVSDYLTKPFGEDQLLGMVKQYICPTKII